MKRPPPVTHLPALTDPAQLSKALALAQLAVAVASRKARGAKPAARPGRPRVSK